MRELEVLRVHAAYFRRETNRQELKRRYRNACHLLQCEEIANFCRIGLDGTEIIITHVLQTTVSESRFELFG